MINQKKVKAVEIKQTLIPKIVLSCDIKLVCSKIYKHLKFITAKKMHEILTVALIFSHAKVKFYY